MKKLILTVFVSFFGILATNAQTNIGAGVFFGNGSTAIEAKADFKVADKISISPSVDYYLVSGYSMFGLGIDGHYNIEASEGLLVYPLIGLNYGIVSGNGFTYGGGLGFTAGGGASYQISDSMKLYAEVKYLNSGVGISTGILFSL